MQFLAELFTSLIIAYLALTQDAATLLSGLFSSETADAPTVAEESSGPSEDSGHELTKLPSDHEYGGPIPRVLIEHSGYQQAAVGAHGSTTTERADTSATTSASTRVSAALVNLYCQHRVGDYIRTTSGSGFFISDRGVILTNAHIAQFLLLDGIEGVRDGQCTVRTGDPATERYTAELLYLPPTWVQEHATLINDERPKGTGERDYALLYVSAALPGEILPDTFPALPVDTALLPRDTAGTEVFAAGFPATDLYENGPGVSLRPLVATTTIDELYTFGSNYADIFSLAASAVGEQGASGGPVVNQTGDALGVIVTKGDIERDGDRSLRAITLSYIDRTMREETGFGLSETLRGDLARRSSIYRDALVPFLQDLLNVSFAPPDDAASAG